MVRNVNLTIAILGLVATIVAAGAAVGSWRAATKANEAATTIAAIEQDRQHAELTPRFRITCQASGGDRAELRVELEGPDGLDRLDEVSVTIRDDRHNRSPSPIAGGPSAEEIGQVIWGPYRFVPHVDGADDLGRSVPSMRLHRGDWTRFALQRSLPPKWNSDTTWWEREWAGQPVRLLVTCRREAHEPWSLAYEVYATHP
jgi:hypothetical protein